MKSFIKFGLGTGILSGIPDYTEFIVADAEKTLKAAGWPAGKIAGELENVRKQFSTTAQVAMALVGQAVVGTLASLILGLFSRTKK